MEMKMKVYEVNDILNECYCADIAIVAAADEKQAYTLVAEKYTESDWYKVVSFEYAMEKGRIKEIKDLQYNGKESKIISFTFYVE